MPATQTIPKIPFFLNKRSWKHAYVLYAAAAAAKLLQLCPTLWDPIDCSPPGSSSLGFSRQEHWSGLPFPSPMHESEKWKWSCSVVSDSLWTHGLQPTRLLHPWNFPGKSTGMGFHCLLQPIGQALVFFSFYRGGGQKSKEMLSLWPKIIDLGLSNAGFEPRHSCSSMHCS